MSLTEVSKSVFHTFRESIYRAAHVFVIIYHTKLKSLVFNKQSKRKSERKKERKKESMNYYLDYRLSQTNLFLTSLINQGYSIEISDKISVSAN